MAFDIDILSIGDNFDAEIAEAAQLLNGVQKEFRFNPPPDRLAGFARQHFRTAYKTAEVFELLKTYIAEARGGRQRVIGVVDRQLASEKLGNLFGSHRAEEGVAVITLHDWASFTESTRQFLCYYLIRYALSFLDPKLRSHAETRDCFFDRKIYKPDLRKSLQSGNLCPDHREQLSTELTLEVNESFQEMTRVMKDLRDDSTEDLRASSLKNQIDVGIISMKPEEYRAVLDRFRRRRRVKGSTSNYSYARIRTAANEDLRVAMASTSEQGQGAAQATAAAMINDLNPRWIFVVGIAGGIPASEFTLGDVLVSKRIHDLSVTAKGQDTAPEFEDLGQPMVLDVVNLVKDLPDLEPRFGAWADPNSLMCSKPRENVPADDSDPRLYGSDEWKKKAVRSLHRGFPVDREIRPPLCLGATFITSNTLVKDTELATSWLTNARHSLAVEMELGGVCAASRSLTGDRTRVMAIRGISDIIGYQRAPEWTEFACHSAASFAHALIVSGIIRRDD